MKTLDWVKLANSRRRSEVQPYTYRGITDTLIYLSSRWRKTKFDWQDTDVRLSAGELGRYWVLPLDKRYRTKDWDSVALFPLSVVVK